MRLVTVYDTNYSIYLLNFRFAMSRMYMHSSACTTQIHVHLYALHCTDFHADLYTVTSLLYACNYSYIMQLLDSPL